MGNPPPYIFSTKMLQPRLRLHGVGKWTNNKKNIVLPIIFLLKQKNDTK